MRLIAILIWLLFWGSMLFGQSPQAQPSCSEVFKIGFAAYQQGNYDLAIKNFNLAISIDPSKSHLYYNRGMAYKAKAFLGPALADFQKSVEMNPTAEAYYQIGLVKYQQDDAEAAKANFVQAKQIKEDLDLMNFYLGMIYVRNKEYEEGAKCLTLYTERVKTNPDAYYYRGFCEAKMNDYPAALRSLKFAMQYRDHDWKYYYKLYEIYMAMGDSQNALNGIAMVIEIGERKAEYFEQRAALYKELGQDYKYDEDMESAKQLQESSTASVTK